MREAEKHQRHSSNHGFLWFASLGLMLASLSVMAAASSVAAQQGESPVITFDDYPANISGSGAAPPITNQYEADGLIFRRGVTALVFNDRSFPPRPDLPRSGDTVITTCYSAEFCSSTITMMFDPPLAELTVFAGYSRSLDERADLLLEGYNRDGKVVTSRVLTIAASDEATPATNALTIQDPSGELVAAQVRWVDESRFLGSLIVDDVTLTPFVPLAELSADPSPIELAVEADPAQERIELSNTGNTRLLNLFLTLDGFDGLVDETGVMVGADYDAQCFEVLEPGRSCDVSVTATPDAANTVQLSSSGTLTVRSATGAPISEIPVEVSVSPLPPATVTTSSTTTSSTATTTSDDNDQVTTPTTEGEVTDTTASPAAQVEQEDEPDPITFAVLIIAGIVLLGLILRWLIRRPKKMPPPPPPSPPQPHSPPRSTPRSQPDNNFVRPSLSAKPDPGTQTIDTPDGSRPSLVVALNDSASSTTLIDHHEGTVQ